MAGQDGCMCFMHAVHNALGTDGAPGLAVEDFNALRVEQRIDKDGSAAPPAYHTNAGFDAPIARRIFAASGHCIHHFVVACTTGHCLGAGACALTALANVSKGFVLGTPGHFIAFRKIGGEFVCLDSLRHEGGPRSKVFWTLGELREKREHGCTFSHDLCRLFCARPGFDGSTTAYSICTKDHISAAAAITKAQTPPNCLPRPRECLVGFAPKLFGLLNPSTYCFANVAAQVLSSMCAILQLPCPFAVATSQKRCFGTRILRSTLASSPENANLLQGDVLKFVEYCNPGSNQNSIGQHDWFEFFNQILTGHTAVAPLDLCPWWLDTTQKEHVWQEHVVQSTHLVDTCSECGEFRRAAIDGRSNMRAVMLNPETDITYHDDGTVDFLQTVFVQSQAQSLRWGLEAGGQCLPCVENQKPISRAKLQACLAKTGGHFKRHQEVCGSPKLLLVNIQRKYCERRHNVQPEANSLLYKTRLELGSLEFGGPAGTFKYKLCCVVCHSGGQRGGHYWCMKQVSWPIPGWSGSIAELSRPKIGASSGLLWVEIDDDKAEVVGPLAFVKDNASQVVAFMYRRVEVSQSP